MAKILLLNGKWKFKWFKPGEYLRISPKPYEESYDDYSWLDCRVPGDVHTYLLEHRLIEDPFLREMLRNVGGLKKLTGGLGKNSMFPKS